MLVGLEKACGDLASLYLQRFRPVAHRLVRGLRRARSWAALSVGQIRSAKPLSLADGFDRGLPIDRYYIEGFLAKHAADIHGRVLEVGAADYSTRFGGGRVTRQDVLHIDDSNPIATIVGDLCTPGTLPAKAFDCIILTQTLQYLFDLPAAIKQVHDALRPGGVALISTPGVAPVCRDDWQESFYWRMTEMALRRLLARVFAADAIEVVPLGNLYAATHFLHGAAVEESSRKKLHAAMPEYAVVICARAVA